MAYCACSGTYQQTICLQPTICKDNKVKSRKLCADGTQLAKIRNLQFIIFSDSRRNQSFPGYFLSKGGFAPPTSLIHLSHLLLNQLGSTSK